MVNDRAFVFHMHVTNETRSLYRSRKGFDDDGHLWNLPRTGAFVFLNTSCNLINKVLYKIIQNFDKHKEKPLQYEPCEI
jgi:hypothetical protein